MKKIKIFVCAMNWGLGHATRCIPLIKIFENLGCNVTLGSDGPSLILLKHEFPHLDAIELPSYGIKYSRILPMAFNMLFQMPKILINIIREKKYIDKIQESECFDIVVSDSRFGCHTKYATNIYLTHQVKIRFPRFMRFLEPGGVFFHHLIIKKFDNLWIIDRKGESSLAGDMSQVYGYDNVFFIGILSRFTCGCIIKKNIDVCFLLSGPEPQRTQFENIIVKLNMPDSKRYCLIRGLPESVDFLSMPANWKVYNHITSEELGNVLLSSRHIVCRSGYSTIMDLVKLGLSATLVPTPGQPEQEYLAEYLSGKFGFRSIKQKSFDEKSIELTENCCSEACSMTEFEDVFPCVVDKIVKNVSSGS
jgi:hypothetical protein